MSKHLDKTVEDYLWSIADSRRGAILHFHHENIELFDVSAGSSYNHQAWRGGYRDHITQCLHIAEYLYKMSVFPFLFDSVIVSIYFHDIEKLTRYSTGETIDKEEFLDKTLSEKGIVFSEEEQNALRFAHGEGDEYTKQGRTMLPLAAFTHVCDTISARIYHDFAQLPQR
jgi:hypothetical protein